MCGALLALAAGCADHSNALLQPPPEGNPGVDPDAADPASNTDPATSNLPSKSTDPVTGTDPNTPPVNPDQPNNPDNLGNDPEVWGTTPPLRDTLALSDTELADQALTLLGSHCSSCHTLGRPTLTHWAQLTREFATDCLANTELSDQAAVDAMRACFSARAGNAAASPENFGVYAAAARLPWFSFLFQHTPDGASAQSAFLRNVAMPVAGQPLTQAEFDLVAEWFARRLPGLFDLVPAGSGEDCVPGVAPSLAPSLNSYLDQMEVSGWRAKNAQVPLLMYGCSDSQAGSACLSTLPRASDEPYSAGWGSLLGTQIRILHDNSASVSNYWSRSSADGRYIGSGLNVPSGDYGGQIIDLQQDSVTLADFAYDATFFPDNSGFLMQQVVNDETGDPGAPTDGSASSSGVALLCSQSVLASTPGPITGTEPECTLAQGKFGLYQQTAKSVDGSDYWVVHGSYEGDNGGFSPVLEEPWAAFGDQSTTTLTPLVNQGNGFETGTAAQVVTPNMGDPMLSPSGGLLVLRVKGPEYASSDAEGNPVATAAQSGYALFSIDKSNGSSTAALHDLGRVCLTGGKATFSYDERWLVFHHYVLPSDAVALGFSGPDDPGFAQYQSQGSSNLMLVDLRTGTTQRLTTMQPGQYALFPHFRSDGWIYFVVRTLNGEEYYAASDAALVAEAAH
jgi:hypothetical protein